MAINKVVVFALGILVIIIGAFIVMDIQDLSGKGEGIVSDAECRLIGGTCIAQADGCGDGQEQAPDGVMCGEEILCCVEA